MSDQARDPGITALEAALAGLTPAPGQLDRDCLMYQAGRASGRQIGWLWPSTTAAMALLAVALGLLAVSRPAQERHLVYITVRQEVPAPSPPLFLADTGPVGAPVTDEPQDQAAYLKLRNQMLQQGVDSLPRPAPSAETPPGPTLQNLLDGV